MHHNADPDLTHCTQWTTGCYDRNTTVTAGCHHCTHSLTAALDQLRIVASSTSNDPCPRSGQHQQIGQCLLPLVAANFFVDDPADASSQQQEECWCGLLLTVAVPAKQVCSPVGDRCDQIINDVKLSLVVCTE